MSPTSYQAAPPRFMTIADAGGCVKLRDFRGNAMAHSFARKAEAASGKGTREDAESVIANALIMPGGWLLWPSIDASGGSPTPRNRAGRPLTRAKRALS